MYKFWKRHFKGQSNLVEVKVYEIFIKQEYLTSHIKILIIKF